jgi:hypothetical protein
MRSFDSLIFFDLGLLIPNWFVSLFVITDGLVKGQI